MKRSIIQFSSPVNDFKLSKLTKEPVNKKHKHVITEDSDNTDDENQFKMPNFLKEEHDKIYLKHNHLYFHDGVSVHSVDLVKKLMREYLENTLNAKKQIVFGTFVPKPLYLHIYSNGGDTHAGLSLYDFINEYKKTISVYTVIEGIGASAGTIISIAGTKRFITPNSYMLIHQLSTFFGGNFEQIKDEFGNCEKVMNQLKEIYTSKTKFNKKQLSDILKKDIILSAKDCLKYGLVDEIKLMDIFNDTE
jgi:ATP-dependent protease ClpP protease subunit